MSSEQSKDQSKPDELTCQICECLFTNPMRLPCCHSFCEVCIEVHWELESTQTEFLCPQAKCEQRWKSKPTLRKDTTLETPAEPAREKLVSEKLDGKQRAANEGGATDEGKASSPQSSPPTQGGSEEWSRARRELAEIFPEWKTKRIEVLKMLAGMIVQLKKRKRDGNISKATGASAGIIGGAMVIAGFALAPVTAGLSLGLSIAGTTTGVAGGITAAGASIAVLVMNKASTKEATENIEKDKIAGARLAEVVRSVYSAASELDVVTMGTLVSERVTAKGGEGGTAHPGIVETATVTVGGIMVARSAKNAAVDIVKNSKALVKVAGAGAANAADDVGFAVAKGVATGGMRMAAVALSSLFLVVDVANLIRAGVNLHKKNPSKIEAHWQGTYDILKLHLVGMAKINDYVERIKK
uniref:Uncharacterized protein LOC116956980 n=1 Tax=Petromyzon marinus TaxID=7757 RepID=A0AAJ7XHD6_PETMA|nr:uncharacterized protein LOC116956980 [Petromyzon marinus]